MTSVVAVVPARDEAERIGPVVEAARRHVPVLVVDDGSTDDTAGVAEAAGATVVRLSENRGKGAALREGFLRALEDSVEAVVTLDADGQHDPGEIPAFLEARREAGADLVIGARDFASMPPARRLANTLGRRVLRWAVGREVPDNQSGYRLMSRRLVESSLDLDEAGFGFEVQVLVECVRRGWPVAWIPIRTIYAAERSHINPVLHPFRFVALAWRIRRARVD